METAVFDCFQPRQKSLVLSGRILFGIGEEYSDGKVHKSEHEPRNGNVNTLYSLIRPGGILESVARSLFTMNEHAIANVYLYLNFLLRICS